MGHFQHFSKFFFHHLISVASNVSLFVHIHCVFHSNFYLNQYNKYLFSKKQDEMVSSLSQVQNCTSNIWPSTLDFKLMFMTIIITVGSITKSYSTKNIILSLFFSGFAYWFNCIKRQLVLGHRETFRCKFWPFDPPEQYLNRSFILPTAHK